MFFYINQFQRYHTAYHENPVILVTKIDENLSNSCWYLAAVTEFKNNQGAPHFKIIHINPPVNCHTGSTLAIGARNGPFSNFPTFG